MGRKTASKPRQRPRKPDPAEVKRQRNARDRAFKAIKAAARTWSPTEWAEYYAKLCAADEAREERLSEREKPFSVVGLCTEAVDEAAGLAGFRELHPSRRYCSRITGLDPSQVEPWESRRSIPYALAVCRETSAGWRPVGW